MKCGDEQLRPFQNYVKLKENLTIYKTLIKNRNYIPNYNYKKISIKYLIYIYMNDANTLDHWRYHYSSLYKVIFIVYCRDLDSNSK